LPKDRKVRVGRKPGVPNNFTRELKEALLDAAEEVGEVDEEEIFDKDGNSTGKFRRTATGKGGLKGYLKWAAVHRATEAVVDLGADGLVTAVPRRFEPMATSDQLITCATPPDDDRFQQASCRNGTSAAESSSSWAHVFASAIIAAQPLPGGGRRRAAVVRRRSSRGAPPRNRPRRRHPP
jgi:hypothetical protein